MTTKARLLGEPQLPTTIAVMTPRTRRKWFLAVEAAVAIVIVVAVAWSFRATLSRLDLSSLPLNFRWEFFIPAGALYLTAHLCWATFWVRLLHGQGIHVPWWIGIRTYFISQFGKYIPGKVAVLAMRVMMLRSHGGHPIPVAVTSVYETLTSMAAGALLAIMFLPTLGVLPPQLSASTTVMIAFAGLPLGLALLNKFAAQVVKKRRGTAARHLTAPSLFLLAQGVLHGACGYCLLACSLSVTIFAIAPAAFSWTAEAYAATLAAVALAYVAGFVVAVAPGGLGAREFVLAALLTRPFTLHFDPVAAAGLAVVVALLLRLVWTAAEVVIGATFYIKKPILRPHLSHHATLPLHHGQPHV